MTAASVGLAQGCASDSDDAQDSGPRGQFTCQTTPEECVAMFTGTYSGTYEGTGSGTWTVYLADDGTIEGTVTTSTGTAVTVTGSVSETGVVTFGAQDVGTFEGTIDFDDNVSGSWSGTPGSGTFTGALVSREPPSEGTGGAGSTTAGTGGSVPGSTGGSTTTYCDRTDAKADECGIPVTGTCTEPTTEEEVCATECLLSTTCAELLEGTGLFDCLSNCPAGGERDYCLEYQDKLETCAKEDTVLLLDICGAPATTETACTWGCVLDATCEAFMDEQALIDSCTAGCEASL